MHRLERAMLEIKKVRAELGAITTQMSLDSVEVYEQYYMRTIRAYAGGLQLAMQHIQDEIDAQCPTEDEYHEHLHDAR